MADEPVTDSVQGRGVRGRMLPDPPNGGRQRRATVIWCGGHGCREIRLLCHSAEGDGADHRAVCTRPPYMEARAVSACWLRNGRQRQRMRREPMTLRDVDSMTVAATPRRGPMRVPDFHSGCAGEWDFAVNFNVSVSGFRLQPHVASASISLLRPRTNGLAALVDLRRFGGRFDGLITAMI